MMRRVARISLIALTCAACNSAEFSPRLAGAGSVPEAEPDLAYLQARQHLARGNVALALQQFRLVMRRSPERIGARLGVAACYDRMGRFELSRRYYEEALALSPDNVTVRHNMAVSLRMQGRNAEAAVLEQPVASAAMTEDEQPEADGSVTIAIVDVPAPIAPASPPIPLAVTTAPRAAPAGMVAARTPAPEPPVAARGDADAPGSVTIKIVDVPAVVSEAPVPKTIVAPPSRHAQATGFKPYLMLQRLSLGEVALVTRRPEPIAAFVSPVRNPAIATRAATTPPMASQAAQRLRLLNGVGRKGLAARVSGQLRLHGWSATIGDSTARPQRSVLAYPRGRRMAAARVAARLPFPLRMIERANSDMLQLLLGQDSLGFDDRLRRKSRT